MKGLAVEHICITHRHRQQCGDGQRKGELEAGGGAKWGGYGDICNNVNNKNEKNTE